MFTCLENCGSNTECSSACYRENVVCVDACPCHAGTIFIFKMTRFIFNLRLSIGGDANAEKLIFLQIAVAFITLI